MTLRCLTELPVGRSVIGQGGPCSATLHSAELEEMVPFEISGSK